MSLVIAAFDLATATGVCDGAVGGKPRVFSWYLDDAGKGRPARLAMLMGFLERYFASQPCDGVAYEAPMPLGMLNSHPHKGKKNRGFFTSTAAAEGDSGFMISEANVAFARGAIGVLEAICAKYGKPVQPVAVQDARESVLGWRTNRDKTIETKKRVIRDVRSFGIEVDGDNEADGYVVWAYACALQNPRLAAAYTPLFRGQE